ncbi:MAG: glycolate oxidase iron-sulfur subunit [Actinomycetota bacterium]
MKPTLHRLHLDEDELASCVACGLCLPHCPTYRVTGEESASPRGRITAMRAVQWGGQPMDETFTEFMDLCVQCRACEVACPSSVPFGHLMEGAREALVERTAYQPWWRRAGYRVLGHHRLLLMLSTVLALAQRVRLVPARLGLPRLPLRRPPLRTSGTDAWLFTGCVMDAWMRPTHAAALRVMEATGAGVALPGAGGDCCGALSAHAGLTDHARTLAEGTMASMPGEAPVVVDSAGCGAAMKEYARLLGTPEAQRFSARVEDVSEWLADRVDRLPAAGLRRAGPVAIQDPCHLRNVQRAHQHVRTVLAPYMDLVELDDEGLCCGAGGAYAALHPDMAGAIRDRKVEAIGRSGASMVASANPGCAMHLSAAGIAVRHPVQLLDEVINDGG